MIPPKQPEHPTDISWLVHPSLQVLFVIASLLVILVFIGAFFLFVPNDGLRAVSRDGALVVVSIEGAGIDAGFKVNDTILSIDGHPVRAQQGPIYPLGVGKGDSVEYVVERDGQRLTLEAKMGGFLDDTGAFGPIIGVQFLALLFWVIGAALCLFAPTGDLRSRLVGIGWLLAGVTAASGGPGTISHFWGADVLTISLSLLGFVFVAAHLYFPTPSLSMRGRNNIIWIFGLGALAVIVIRLAGVRWIAMIDRASSDLAYGYFLICLVVSLLLLGVNRLNVDTPDVRWQTGIILWATALSFGPFAVLSLLPVLLVGQPYLEGQYSILFLAVLPLAYAYAINQRALLRIDFLINRALVFFILILLVLFVSISVLGIVALIFNLPPNVPLLGGALALLIVMPSAAVQKNVQIGVNRVLYGGHYDYSSVTSNLSSNLARALNRETLVELMTGELEREMGIHQSALFLRKDRRSVLLVPEAGSFVIPVEDELCRILLEAGQPARRKQLFGLLSTEALLRWEDFSWGEMFVPLVLEEQIYGLLVLGGRLAGEIYSDLDLRILATVAHQGALAAANVLLVDELRGLTQRLVRDDEAQRKGLARDLHDEVLQNLFFVKQLVLKLDQPKINDNLDSVIRSLRNTIRAQRSAVLNQGLSPALQDLLHEMQERTGERLKFHWEEDRTVGNDLLDDEQATTFYRITQEALTNAIKHAQAESVTVCLTSEQREEVAIIRLIVEDDGIGMRQDQTIRDGHFGLIGMEERARMIWADLKIDSQPGKGTRVILECKT